MSFPSASGQPPGTRFTPRAGRRWPLVLALAALALLYFLTIPANHTEAEDGYWYAYDTREKSYHALFHLHHLLYLPLMRLLYTTTHFPDAFQMMMAFDILCAVTTVGLLYRWLTRGLQLGWQAGLFACLFLAFSYGYWRYAVEAEVYLPASVLMVLLASRVFRRPAPVPGAPSVAGEVGTAVLGAASMLMHAPLSAPLAVVAVPFYWLLKRRFRAFVIYGGVATVLVVSAYYTAYRVELASHDPALVPPPAATFTGFLTGAKGEIFAGIGLSNVPKAVTGLGASVVSSNYLFAIPRTRDKLFAAFPTRNFTEETFMARAYRPSLAYLGLALTVVLLALIGFTAVRRLDWSGPRLRALVSPPESLAILLWLLVYSALIFVIEPDDPENWVCSLLPLAALAALCVNHLYRDLDRARIPWIFAGLLFAQNLVGGMLIIHHPESDFNRHKAAWIVAHAHAGDVVFTRDNEVFSRYLRYHTTARVVNCFFNDAASAREVIAGVAAAPGGTRYLFLDVIEPPGYMRLRVPGMYDDLADLRQKLLPILQPTGAEDVRRLP